MPAARCGAGAPMKLVGGALVLAPLGYMPAGRPAGRQQPGLRSLCAWWKFDSWLVGGKVSSLISCSRVVLHCREVYEALRYMMAQSTGCVLLEHARRGVSCGDAVTFWRCCRCRTPTWARSAAVLHTSVAWAYALVPVPLFP